MLQIARRRPFESKGRNAFRRTEKGYGGHGQCLVTAQSLLGHSDLETTLNVYTHALPASQRRAVERVSEVMFSIVLELGENEQEGKSN